MTQPTREQLNRLTAAIPGVVYQFRTTPDGRWAFLYLSPGIRDLYEVSPEDAYADHDAMTTCLLPEDRESHRRSVEEALRTLRAGPTSFASAPAAASSSGCAARQSRKRRRTAA